MPAFSFQGISRSTFRFLDTGLRLSIENAYHAVAIDEHRADFAPTLWTKKLPKDPNATVAAPRSISCVEQRWFVGAHANVGGGVQSDPLSQVPLKWIVGKAVDLGLRFKSEIDVDDDFTLAPVSDSYAEFASGMYRLVKRRHLRPIGEPPSPDMDAAHVNVNETIDESVFERWRTDGKYRPKNLKDWATKRGVDPSQLVGSCSAEDPSVTIEI